MTTREDYEHAARAAGMEIEYYELDGFLLDGRRWNPEHDDGDSRRLEVACRMNVSSYEEIAIAANPKFHARAIEPVGPDPCAATRAAVFRCAVEIGKRLKKGGE